MAKYMSCVALLSIFHIKLLYASKNGVFNFRFRFRIERALTLIDRQNQYTKQTRILHGGLLTLVRGTAVVCARNGQREQTSSFSHFLELDEAVQIDWRRRKGRTQEQNARTSQRDAPHGHIYTLVGSRALARAAWLNYGFLPTKITESGNLPGGDL